MIEDIKNFYNKTKLKEIISDDGPSPVSYSHTFYKTYPRFPSVALPKTRKGKNLKSLKGLDQLWAHRKSIRSFSEEGLFLEDLATVLRSNGIIDSEDRSERRTYPSAGARFPIEAYVIAFNVKGLEPGAYHYDIRGDKLELLLKKDLKEKEIEIVSPFLENTSAAIVLTSVISRLAIKYGYKAYPYSFVEAGHVGQNIQLVCSQEGLGSCCIGGFLNDTLVEILDLIDDNEIPLYVIGLGKLKK